MQKIYKWRNGARYSGLVAVVGQELDKIRASNNGIAAPRKVLETARNTNSPLHRYFEWNDNTAAEQWRLEQARNLVQSVEVICGDKSDAKPIRAYVSVEKNGKRGYMEITDVMTDVGLRKQLLSQALSDAESYEAKYKALTELQPVFKAIGKVKLKTKKKQQAA